MIVRAGTRQESEEIGNRVGAWLSPDARSVVAVDESGALCGGVVYDNWSQTGCFAHMWVARPSVWWSLRKPALAYPFEEGGRLSVLASIQSTNERSLRWVRHLGLREVARIPQWYAAGEDMVLMELRREWLRSESEG